MASTGILDILALYPEESLYLEITASVLSIDNDSDFGFNSRLKLFSKTLLSPNSSHLINHIFILENNFHSIMQLESTIELLVSHGFVGVDSIDF